MAKTLAQRRTDLETRRDAVYTKIAALDEAGSTQAAVIGAHANNSGPNQIDHVGYKESLYRELAAIEKMLAAIRPTVMKRGVGIT